MQNGKGDLYRKVNTKVYNDNFDAIKWDLPKNKQLKDPPPYDKPKFELIVKEY